MTDRERPDPTKEPEFKRVLKNLLTTPHKPQSEVKGKGRKSGQKRLTKDR